MDIRITPHLLEGTISVIPSKSQAHRYLICAAFGTHPVRIFCPGTNSDMEATADCLRALGAEISVDPLGFRVNPVRTPPEQALLPCRDSGSTLRFLLPVAGALGVDAVFQMEGRLPRRPLSPLWEEMERMGCRLTRSAEDTVRRTGKLRPGHYTLDGSVSSQFATGLLLAFPLLNGPCELTLTGKPASRPYLAMTRQALALFAENPSSVTVEGDWSTGAFWLAANALGSRLRLQGLCQGSCQGDRAAAVLIPALHRFQTISAADIPDLIPILAVVAACHEGACFTQTGRLRLKESDRVDAICRMLHSLGGSAEAEGDTLTVHGTGLAGGEVDPFRDHRIAMAAAIASTVCREPVVIRDAECVAKSNPRFWEDFAESGGIYEQYIR